MLEENSACKHNNNISMLLYGVVFFVQILYEKKIKYIIVFEPRWNPMWFIDFRYLTHNRLYVYSETTNASKQIAYTAYHQPYT